MSKLNRKKFWTVVGREFFVRVRKKSFLVTTILVPILMVAVMAFVLWMTMNSVAKERIAILDETGQYASLFEDTPDYSFFTSHKSLEDFKSEGKENSEEATIILRITDDLLHNPKAITLYGYNEIPIGVTSLIEDTLSDYLTKKKLEETGIPNLQETVEACTVSLSIDNYKWDKQGNTKRSSGIVAGIIGIVLAFLSFNYVASYGALVMAGVLEEKKSRIMEVMVSSVRPIDLMGGKIVGIALVGIFQLLIWALFLGVLFLVFSLFAFGGLYDLSAISQIVSQNPTGGMMAGMDASFLADMQNVLEVIAGINIPHLILMFLLYFVGGYLLYASLYAAIAASMSSDEDANQFMMPIMIVLMVAFYSGFGSMNNPNGTMAVWCSIIPFTSPVAMLVRTPAGVPVWQQVLSLVLLYLSTFAMLWISAKIYRVGILMYGKKPTLKEMARWLFYK